MPRIACSLLLLLSCSFALGDELALPSLAPGGEHAKAVSLKGWQPAKQTRAEPWSAPGRPALRLQGALSCEVAVPPAEGARAKAGATWGLAAVDLLGGDAGAVYELAVLREGKVVASVSGRVEGTAAAYAGTGWRAKASAAARRAGRAIDGDPLTAWVGAGERPWLAIDLGRPRALQGALLLPARSAERSARIESVRLEGSADGASWTLLREGALPPAIVDPWAPRLIRLPRRSSGVRHLRLTVLRSGGKPGVAELLPWSAADDETPRAWPLAEADGGSPDAGRPGVRRWLPIPSESMAAGKLTVRLTARSGAAVFAGVTLCRLHARPSGKLAGKPNGKLGPDKLGAGGLGFDALAEHGQSALTVLATRPLAARAGLRVGDVIVAVDGEPLGPDSLAPGWRWFRASAEARLGRATLAAARAGRAVELTVLRPGAGVPRAIRIKSAQPAGAWESFPAEAMDKHALYQDVLASCLRRQAPNGSWGGNVIRTSLASLALLATRDRRHAPAINRSLRWMLAKHPRPTAFGNLGFWASSYAAMFYAEARQATGDDRLDPRLAAIFGWAIDNSHTSTWQLDCLGHGPNGLPYGMKSLVAPTAHLLVGEAIAVKAGVGRARLWPLVRPTMIGAWSDPAKGGHGGLGYNASYKDKGEFWSRTALFALSCKLRGEDEDVTRGALDIMTHRHAWLRNSHAYGEPGAALGLTALAALDRQRQRTLLGAYAWWFALAWEPGYGLRFSQPHMGAPYMGTDDLLAAAYALVLAADRQTLLMTGATPGKPWLRLKTPVKGSKLPVGRVRVRRDGEGRLILTPDARGMPVVWTRDPSLPPSKWARYRRPVARVQGEVQACVLPPGGEPGEMVKRVFGLPKGSWRVREATGHRRPEEARRRAALALDDDLDTHWRADAGQDAKSYPHRLIIELDKPRALASLVLHLPDDKHRPTRVQLRWSVDGEAWSKPASHALEAGRRVLPLAARARQLELVFPEGKGGLLIAELDLLPAR